MLTPKKRTKEKVPRRFASACGGFPRRVHDCGVVMNSHIWALRQHDDPAPLSCTRLGSKTMGVKTQEQILCKSSTVKRRVDLRSTSTSCRLTVDTLRESTLQLRRLSARRYMFMKCRKSSRNKKFEFRHTGVLYKLTTELFGRKL